MSTSSLCLLFLSLSLFFSFFIHFSKEYCWWWCFCCCKNFCYTPLSFSPAILLFKNFHSLKLTLITRCCRRSLLRHHRRCRGCYSRQVWIELSIFVHRNHGMFKRELFNKSFNAHEYKMYGEVHLEAEWMEKASTDDEHEALGKKSCQAAPKILLLLLVVVEKSRFRYNSEG